MSVKPIDSHQEPFVYQMAKKALDPMICALAFACLGIVVAASTTTFTATLISGGIIAVIGCGILLGIYLAEGADQKAPRISVGIPNLGNTCWLNSALKFMASTAYYDSMLTTRIDDKQELRNALRRIFNFLRNEHSESVQLDRDLLHDLFAQINKHLPDFTINGRQYCSQEFIVALMAVLQWEPKDKPITADYVMIKEAAVRYHNPEVASDFISIKVNNTAFDLQQAIFQQEEVESDSNESNDTYMQTRVRIPVKLPDNLMIHVGHNPELGHDNRPQLKTENGLVTLYEMKFDEDGIPSISKKIAYRIQASLIQRGSETRGHWVCSLRDQNEYSLHNDSDISSHDANTIELQGCFIHPVKVN